MGTGYDKTPVLVLLLSIVLGCFIPSISANNLKHDIDLTWGGHRAQFRDDGKLLSLTLDQISGSGFQSKSEYLFGRVDMQIKLVAGNSAGTVTAFYLSSEGYSNRDEIDLEFLGNLSGQPYTVHTNVYTQGQGDREQQFHLWFDPTKDFHLYSILWNPNRIIFLVDNIPIRVYENEESIGVPFPNKQPMRLYSSLWSADQWATRGGLVKTDWSRAPFTAFYRNFNANACLWSNGRQSSSCASSSSDKAIDTHGSWQSQGLDAYNRRMLRWVRNYYIIYNYCTDYKRFPLGRPLECRRHPRNSRKNQK